MLENVDNKKNEAITRTSDIRVVNHKLSYDKNRILGTGSSGSNVYEGSYDGVVVAVKRLQIDQKYNDKEIRNLMKITHQNIIRYLGREEDPNFYYINLELCDATLEQFMDDPKLNYRQKLSLVDKKHLLTQIVGGTQYLHDHEDIVHRDIKPSNILIKGLNIGTKLTAKISDFGLSRQLEHGRDDVTVTNEKAGSRGYRPPEILNASVGDKPTNRVDVFQLGCIFQFVMTRVPENAHPFGPPISRDHNIGNKKSRQCFVSEPGIMDNDSILLDMLINHMIREIPTQRPSCATILSHPFFWKNRKIMNFIRITHEEYLGKVRKNYCPDIVKTCVPKLEKVWNQLYGVIYPTGEETFNWKCEEFSGLPSVCDYDEKKLTHLVRLIRNIGVHYEGSKEQYDSIFQRYCNQPQPNPEGVINFFTKRFPILLCVLYYSYMRVFYDGNNGVLTVMNVDHDETQWVSVRRTPSEEEHHTFYLDKSRYSEDVSSLSLHNFEINYIAQIGNLVKYICKY